MEHDRQHPLLARLQLWLAEGSLKRRDFLRLATLLGVAAPLAYRMIGARGEGAMIASAHASARSGGRLTLGMRVQEIESPHALSWLPPANLVQQVCEPLTWTGFDNVTRPKLLSHWTASPDLRQWDLFLRRDIAWHSGRAFTADDVVWNLRHLLDPATGSSAMGLMQSYLLLDAAQEAVGEGPRLWDASAIEKIDDFHVRLNLKRPQLAVPEHLFHYTNVMLDPDEGGRFGVGANGTGPFSLRAHVVGEQALLAAVESDGRSRAKLDEVQLVDLGDEPATSAAALVSGQVDGLDRCDYSVAESLARRPDFTVHQTATSATAMLQMRVTQAPFDDVRVRRAMRLAIDTAEVTRLALRGFGTPAEHHLVAPSHPDYAPLPAMRRDPGEARRLLAEAGYPQGIDIEITCKNWPSWELAAVQAMVEQYREAAIRAAIRVLPAPRFWEIWDQAPLAFVEWAPRPLGFMLLGLTVRSGMPWNSTGFSDALVDELLQQAEATADVEARRAILGEIERRMQDIGPMVQPAWLSVVTVMSKRVRGFRLHPTTLLSAAEYSLVN